MTATCTNDSLLHTAVPAVQKFKSDGIGFVFSPDDPYCGIDLDHCRNLETGETADWARAIIEAINSYTEISPSGDGVHILIRAAMPSTGTHHKKPMADGGKIEIYDRGRYFTMTGNHLLGTPTTIEYRQTEFDQLYGSVFPPIAKSDNGTRTQSHCSSLSDAELINKAMGAANGAKFARLWSGNTSDFGGDDSSADLSLCCMLAFWTDKTAERMNRLFQQSGLMRPKWNRGDYKDRTIAKAIRETAEVWQPGLNHPNTEEVSSLSSHIDDG